MRKDVSAMRASTAFKKEKLLGSIRAGFLSGLEEERKRRLSTIQFLDENIRKIETLARTFLDDLTNPNYFPEHERDWRERALVSIEQKKRIFAMTIRILQDDEKAQYFLKRS